MINTYFVHITKLAGEKETHSALNINHGILKDAAIAVPLKYLSNCFKITQNAIDYLRSCIKT